MSNEIRREIRGCIEMVRSCKGGSHATTALCSAHNWATNPFRAMTDWEHRDCRRFARAVVRMLSRRTGWREMENGIYWPFK